MYLQDEMFNKFVSAGYINIISSQPKYKSSDILIGTNCVLPNLDQQTPSRCLDHRRRS